jgi:RNA polymerase sigma-70 factor, ECF subfamily
MSSLNIGLSTIPAPPALSSNRQEACAPAAASVDWVALVAQIRAGDDDGIDQLFKLFNRGIRHLLVRQLGPRNLEDRVDETLLRVVRDIQHGDLLEPDGLMGFVRYVAQLQVRAYANEEPHRQCHEVELEAVGPSAADRKANPESQAWEHQRAELVKTVLMRLSPRDREILERIYLMEQTDEQIQAEMSLTEDQFRLLKPRAKQHFGKHGKKHLAKHRHLRAVPSLDRVHEA